MFGLKLFETFVCMYYCFLFFFLSRKNFFFFSFFHGPRFVKINHGINDSQYKRRCFRPCGFG